MTQAREGRLREPDHPLNRAPGKVGSSARLDGYVNLAFAMLGQAYRDCFSDSPARALDALYWLSSQDAQIILNTLGLNHHPLEPITTAQRQTRTKFRKDAQ